MKTKFTKIIALGTVALSLFSFNSVNTIQTLAESNQTRSYTNHDGATYYSGISKTSTGSTLLSELNSLNKSKRKSTVGYKAMLNSPSKGYYVTDPGTGSNTITSFYSGRNVNGTSGLNREHVWPKSRGGDSVDSDIHMTRPTLNAENGSRGNSFYVEGKKSSSGGWDPAMEDFGIESYRGDAARIIFYCAIADKSLTIVDKTDDSTGNKTMGKLSDLLKWNINYPVLERERVRNEGAESLQGNRNPFIDNPSYACRIWGNTNDTTKAICKGHYGLEDEDTAPVLQIYVANGSTNTELTSSSVNLIVGQSINLVGYVNGTINSSVSWSVSGDAVTSSSYTNGKTFVGAKVGTSTVTAKISYKDGNDTKYVEKTITINVTSNETPPTPGNLTLTVTGSCRTTYAVGDTFDASGLTIVATFNDGSQRNVTYEMEWSVNIIDENTTFIVGSYMGATITIPITIGEYKANTEGCEGSVVNPTFIISISGVCVLGILLFIKKKVEIE